MTMNGAATMAGRKEEGKAFPFHTRPSLISKHSSSVPSTPHQLPRDFSGYRSRSPSPTDGLGSHSPRSVASEANATLPPLRKLNGGCKFETNMAFGRRRIPYNIGSDPLPKEEDVKVSLDPHEEDKLSGDMRELYDRLLPSAESDKRRTKLVKKLETWLHTEWPGNEFKVHVFGSSGNMLCTSESDVDICIQTTMKKLETMHSLAELLAKHGMERIVCVPSAKVPIVKMWDPQLKLASDINVNNTLALENTRMIRTYIQIDDRVRPLAMTIKHWTQRRILNDAALGGTLSSYTWICMILNFLQTRNPPVLPALHRMVERDASGNPKSSSDFADDLDKLQGFGKENKETLGQLLFQFFRTYGHIVDYDTAVISVRHGRLLTRKEKNWDLASLTKEGRDRLCIEEPFNTYRNLGNSADDTAFRGIHQEIRDAFKLLADGQQLDACCKQYEYPEEKPTPLWKKPSAGPRPVVSLTNPHTSRGGRGGGSMRGRGGYQQKGSNSYRRASTASYGNGRPPFLPTTPLGMSTQDMFARGLENHLFQQYQLLEMQQNQLKAQIFAQSQAQQAQINAHFHAQVQAHAHAQSVAGQGRNGSMSGSPGKGGGIPNGTSSPRTSESAPASAPIMPTYLYPYPMPYDANVTTSMSTDGTRTNPSSPSLPQSIPSLRRGAHRTSAASEANGSIRSQSQPARSVPTQLPTAYPPLPPGYDPALLAAMQIQQMQAFQARSRHNSNAEAPQPSHGHATSAPAGGHGMLKEYIGYTVDSPESNVQYSDYTVPPIPSWTELSQRRRRVSPELPSAALLSSAMRRVSRSPSPLSGGHFRSYSTGLRSAPLPQQPFVPADQRADPTESLQNRPAPAGNNGLLIVNGSYPHAVQEPTEHRTDDVVLDTGVLDEYPVSAYMSPPEGGFGYEQARSPNQQLLYANELLERHNAADAPSPGVSNERPASSATSPQTNGLTIVSSQNARSAQPFPPFVDNAPLVANEYPMSAGEGPSPRLEEQNLYAHTAQALNGVSPLDIPQTNKEPAQHSLRLTNPQLLSPVAEARTPSPTTNRPGEKPKQQQHQRQKSALAPKANGSAARDQNQLPPAPKPVNAAKELNVREDKKDSPTTEISKQTSSNNQQSNNWQKSSNKRRNNKKKSGNAKSTSESKVHGEGQPMPVNESERKGG